MLKYFIYFLSFVKFSNTFDLCVVGASSGLGRELIYQSIKERNKNVLGLSNIPYPIYEPFRGDGYEDIMTTDIFKSSKLVLDSYWNNITDDYKNIIFCTGGTAFENDYSDKLMKKFLTNLTNSCETISLVSAYGVGDSLKLTDIGIQIMEKIYLKDVYRAKNVQEKLLNMYPKKNIKKYIYRPRALSYGNTYCESTTRYELALDMLNNINL